MSIVYTCIMYMFYVYAYACMRVCFVSVWYVNIYPSEATSGVHGTVIKTKKRKNGEEHKGITTTRDHRMSRKSNRNGNENRMAGRVEIRFRIPVYFRSVS